MQVLVGPAPYGVHLWRRRSISPGWWCCIGWSGRRWAACRRSSGCVLLFLPSLFAWSISALKEPLFFPADGRERRAGGRVVRGPGWWQRARGRGRDLALAAALETVRPAGGLLSAAACVGGLALACSCSAPRLLLAIVVAVPLPRARR